LTEVINDRAAATRLMNDQVQLGLAIGGPVLLLLIGLAPWAVTLLYSAEFAPAAELLQWQTVGNIFKLASWALAFSIVAAARSKTFLLIELSFNIVFLALVWLMMPVLGLKVTAIAFLVGYFVYFVTVSIGVHIIQGFRWQTLSLLLLALHVTLALALLALARTAPQVTAIVSVCLAMATGLFGLRVVLSKVGMHGRLPIRLYGIFDRLGWPIQSAVEVK
jgi:PST family polysaccharide transporter